MKRPVLLACGLLFLAPAVGQQTRPAANSMISCADSPLLSELDHEPAKTVLKAYGYDLQAPWKCVRIDSRFTVGSTLLQFRKVTSEADDFTEFSVLKVAGSPYLWVIPNYQGMVAPARVESDPHNVAAFNALLRSVTRKPSSPAEWLALGKLYMTLIVGEGEAIATGPGLGYSEAHDSPGDHFVTFADRPLSQGERYVKWVLTFSSSPDGTPMVVDASRETAGP